MDITLIKEKVKVRGESVPIKILLVIVALMLGNPCFSKNQPRKGLETVVIDPGHGGKDPGAVVGNAREKDIVLSIGLNLGKLIKERLPDVKVVYTRSTDVFIPLFERSVIANKNNADLFISIHANYCSTPSVKGTETYVLGLHRTEDNLNVAKKENSVILLEKDYTTRYEGFNPNLSESYILFELIQNTHIDQSVLFAGILQDNFKQHAQRANRDVRQAGFIVLRETAMPSVLIETGYLSNLSEANYLMTNSGRETLASSIFNSFQSYKEKYDARLNMASGEQKTNKKEADTAVAANPIVEIAKDETPQQPETQEKKTKDSIDKKNKLGVVKEVEPEPKPIIKQEVKPEIVKIKTQSAEITFAIQLAASPKKIPLNSRTFKGIEDIIEMRIDQYFKYYCFRSGSLTKTKQNFPSVRTKIPDAFIVAFKGEQPISIKEALNNKK
jgi:N-acetylmuramoyl-L-alanine amidase